ncbi:hypothetical protein NDU88_007876 [Pleurodeles waltl]|uniref:Uncharacterized protein n=1 Tax=Pleurodeles waltl TaxID=8319 RepID=A0AAV7NCN4_PLEWA|nr:hypothetical protein NDU88_007876 [Pleurodeles waltl]
MLRGKPNGPMRYWVIYDTKGQTTPLEQPVHGDQPAKDTILRPWMMSSFNNFLTLLIHRLWSWQVKMKLQGLQRQHHPQDVPHLALQSQLRTPWNPKLSFNCEW